MNLRQIIERGFSSANLCAGGAQDGAKWHAQKHQVYLVAEMRLLAANIDGIDRDPDLSVEGKARRKVELARKALDKIRTESVERFQTVIQRQRDLLRGEAEAHADDFTGKSDLRQLLDFLKDQRLQDSLARMDGTTVLGELTRAVRDGDAGTYRAIVNMPPFDLRRLNIDPQTIESAKREWMRATVPSLVTGLTEAETAVRLSRENLEEVERAIHDFVGWPAERESRAGLRLLAR